MRSPPIDKNPGDFVAQGSRTAIRRFNRKIPRHSESHKMKGGVLLQLAIAGNMRCYQTLASIGRQFDVLAIGNSREHALLPDFSVHWPPI